MPLLLPSISLLVFKLQLRLLRKMCSSIQTLKESLFWFLSSTYILYRYDLHCALKNYMSRAQYALQGSHEFERFFPKTYLIVLKLMLT